MQYNALFHQMIHCEIISLKREKQNHAKVCRKTKLETSCGTTSTFVHDSKRGAELVDDNDAKGEVFWLDANYVGTESAL
ncbi:MAG: hypothetical protein IK005_02245 [Paludibacteraceae bacterium]|nr:hypothetical protein [Paludibacteraceae bacterium]